MAGWLFAAYKDIVVKTGYRAVSKKPLRDPGAVGRSTPDFLKREHWKLACFFFPARTPPSAHLPVLFSEACNLQLFTLFVLSVIYNVGYCSLPDTL